MSNDVFAAMLMPIIDLLKTLDIGDAAVAERKLNAAFPMNGPLVTQLAPAFARGITEGWLCNREGGGARFSRVAKPGEATHQFSIDAVQLAGAGVWHRHPRGEVDLCMVSEGTPAFDGRGPGWIVYGAGTEHVPTVTGGRMNILYFLPGGALEWKK